MIKESSSVTGDRGGGPEVAGLCPEQGGGMGMVTDKKGGAKADRTSANRSSFCAASVVLWRPIATDTPRCPQIVTQNHRSLAK